MSLSRQPPSGGRKQNGGKRVGEMEIGCFLSHGAISFLNRLALNRSDLSDAVVCKKCKMMAEKRTLGENSAVYFCPRCPDQTEPENFAWVIS